MEVPKHDTVLLKHLLVDSDLFYSFLLEDIFLQAIALCIRSGYDSLIFSFFFLLSLNVNQNITFKRYQL